jgi:hypothetical protein
VESAARPGLVTGKSSAGDAILMLSEEGEVILIETSPKAYRELGSFQAHRRDHLEQPGACRSSFAGPQRGSRRLGSTLRKP